MIIARSPLRISLGGGGTDLPSYSNIFGGYVLSAAIDKYVYVSANFPFEKKIKLKYSKFEEVIAISEIEHPIIREALRLLDIKNPQVEISSLADIPSGTGLGSSGSFTTCLLKTLSVYCRIPLTNLEIAELAARIEIEILGEPVGKQDQYISALGGITEFYFNTNGTVEYKHPIFTQETIFDLEDNLLLFYTGETRSASDVLSDQNLKTIQMDSKMLDNLHETKAMGLKIRECLISGKVEDFGELMNEHWIKKRERSAGISNPKIDEIYKSALINGAVGGKLVGAGGAGFLLFYSRDKIPLRETMRKFGLPEIRFNFDIEGTKAILT
jgi:D-glycero-alpha-D-manno-heptose-7-phosphate kinase